MSGLRSAHARLMGWVSTIVGWTMLLIGPGMNILGTFLAYQGSALAVPCIAVGTIMCLGFQWTMDRIDPPAALSKTRASAQNE